MHQSATFGRYQLMELIAKGGMAEVFKAKLTAAAGTEKQLCIKRILPRLSQNSEFMTLFIREAKIALPLNHGNITQVYDFGEVEGVYYLAMEYIRGQNLNQIIARLREVGKTLDIAAALHIAAEVCKGLQFAHAYTDGDGRLQVVVHRDVSPHNVLISYTGQVKLTDFGIALAATKARANDGVVRGKPCYVSPEQADGQATDPRSDIFSLGTVLYEALTGQRCFEADAESETLARVRAAAVDPPSVHNADVDEEIDAIVLKALARDPAQRFARAGDMQVALTSALHRLDPSYTSEKLAETVKELFAWEIEQGERGAGSDNGQRDRLLFQLARAGVAVEDHNASTGELLEMRTVAIESAGVPDTPSPWRKWLPLGSGIVGVLAAIVVLALAIGGGGGGEPPKPDAAPLPRMEPTEHLTQPSLRMSEGSTASHESETPPPKGPTPAASRVKAPRASGFLNCNSWPWSVVYLDGRRLRGNTPIYRVKVAAGRHKLRFENPELGLSKEVAVSVDANEIKTVAVSLQ